VQSIIHFAGLQYVKLLFIKEDLLRKFYIFRRVLTMIFKYNTLLLIRAQTTLIKPVIFILYHQLFNIRKQAYIGIRALQYKNKKVGSNGRLIGTYSGGTVPLIKKTNRKTKLSLINCGYRAGCAAFAAGIKNLVVRLRSQEILWRFVLKGLIMSDLSINAFLLNKQIAFNGCRGKKRRRV